MKKYPVVILHGWGLSHAMFVPLVNEFGKHHIEVFAPDLPGFGDSNVPDKPLKLDDYVSFFHDYLKENKLEDVVVIGHSFGGRVALKYQARYPKHVHALILTGTPGFTPVAKRKLMLFITLAKLGKVVFSLPILNTWQETVRKWYYYVVGARDYFRAESTMRQTFKNIVKEELLTSMKAIGSPTLLLWGEKDIITPPWIANKMHDVIHGSKLIVVPDIGHALPYKHPKEFVQALLPWLQTI